MVMKYKDITVYNDGVLINQTVTGGKTIELISESEFLDMLNTSDNVYVKSTSIEQVSKYIGKVKGIIVLNNDNTLSNIKTIPNKKMVEVGYL